MHIDSCSTCVTTFVITVFIVAIDKGPGFNVQVFTLYLIFVVSLVGQSFVSLRLLAWFAVVHHCLVSGTDGL